MRAKFSVLKPFKMFRGLNIIFDTKRKQFENSVVIFSESKENTIKIINSRLFEQQHIRSFYMDKFLNKAIFKRLIQTDRVNIYKDFKESTNLTLTPLNTGVLREKNVYLPTWKELNQLFLIPGAKNKSAFLRNFSAVMSILSSRGSEPIYKRQYLVIDSNIFGKEFGDSEAQRIRGLCIGSLIYLNAREAIVQKKPELWPFIGKDVILYDEHEHVAFPIPSDISKLSLSKFKWMLNIMHKLSTGKTITAEDMAEENAPDSETVVKEAGQKINTAPSVSTKAVGYVMASSKNFSIEKNNLVFENPGEAFIAFCKAEYPDVSAILNKNTITIMMDAGTPALAKALYTEKISLFKTEDTLVSDAFEKIAGGYKAKKNGKAILQYALNIKKSGDKFGSYSVVLEIGTDHPVITKTKTEVLKKVEGMKNAIPLSAEQRELVYSINDRIEELSEGKDMLDPSGFLEDVENDSTIRKLKNDLNASRLMSVQNKRAAEVVEKLEDKQAHAKIKINGEDVDLETKLKELETIALKPIVFEGAKVLNEEMKKSSSRALRDAYRTDMYEYDQYRIFTQFSKAKDIPIFVENIERVDSSTPFTAKETLTIKFNIAGEKPKSMQIDVPIVDQDGYLYIQGSRKQVTNQITMMPITKVMQSGELVVQYNTSYNKIFLSRSGGNFNRKAANIIKAFEKLNAEKKLKGNGYKILLGRSTETNDGVHTSLEFYELSKKIVSVQVEDLNIAFSKKIINEIMDAGKIELDAYKENFPEKDYHFIGTVGGKLPVFESTVEGVFAPDEEGNPTKIADDICQLIRSACTKNNALAPVVSTEEYSGTNFSYTKLEVSNAYIPLLVFLAFKDGLEEIFDRYGISYVFIPKEGKKNYFVPEGCTEKVLFKDGTMFFNPENVKKNLLAFGIYQLPTKDFSINDFKADGEGYYQYFIDKVTPRYGKALQNFYALFIDPITSDILKDNSIPNDITGSFLYCNDLLQDASYNHRYDMKIYRMRNLECINALLYKLVARQIEKYRRGSRGDTAGTLAVRKDALFQEINDAPNFEDSTILNPTKECENISKAIYKGPGAPAYSHIQGTEEHRYFDKSQRGIYGIGSSYDGNAGMNRRLTMNAMITSKRGYLHTDEPASNLDATNLYSLGDLSLSFTSRHADPPRGMMAVIQTGHQLPTEHMNHSLVSSGSFKVVPYFVSNEFVFKAPFDGTCMGQDSNDKNIINLKYKDGTRGVIDTATKYRRSPDGFFINIDLKPCIKKGEKFKKGDILAYDEHFFSNGSEGVEMMKGTLAKVAIVGRDITLEDSSCISESLSEKLATSIVMETTLTLSPSTNLISIAKVGQEIRTSENLAVFEERLDNIDVSNALDKMGSLADSLNTISQNTKTSKYTGTIVDIELFYNHPIEEYSPSLQKLIKAYINASKHKEENLSSVRKDQFMRKRDLEPQKNSKAKGVPFDGILVNFYVKIKEEFAVGDKLTYDVSLKSVVGQIIPQNQAPTTEYDDNPVDGCLSPFSMLNRKVPDVLYLMYTNKVLVSLKKYLLEIAK